jgi:hypothetical protein
VHSRDHGSPLGDRSSPGGSSSAHAAAQVGAALATPNDSPDGDGVSEELQLLGLRDTKLQVHFLAAAAEAGGGARIVGAGPEGDRCRKQGQEGGEAEPGDDRGSDARVGERTFPRERKLPRNSRKWPRCSNHRPSDVAGDCNCLRHRVSLDPTNDGSRRSSEASRSPCQGCMTERGTHHGTADDEDRLGVHRSHGLAFD